MDYRGDAKRQRAQWAAAEFPGTPRNQGIWGDRQMGRRGDWGAPRNTNRWAVPLRSTFFAFMYFRSSLSPFHPTSAKPKRLGGFETPGIVRWADYRGEEEGHRAQWATAELVGAPRNHGQWEDRQNGPPRQLAEPQGTLTGGNYAAKSDFFARFQFRPSLSPPFHPPFRNTQLLGGFETPGIGRCAEYRSEEKGHRAQWVDAELGGIPRNPAERQQGGLFPRTGLVISVFELLLFSPPSPPLPQYPTFRRFRIACSWLAGGI